MICLTCNIQENVLNIDSLLLKCKNSCMYSEKTAHTF
jgi:hypothetical protein